MLQKLTSSFDVDEKNLSIALNKKEIGSFKFPSKSKEHFSGRNKTSRSLSGSAKAKDALGSGFPFQGHGEKDEAMSHSLPDEELDWTEEEESSSHADSSDDSFSLGDLEPPSKRVNKSLRVRQKTSKTSAFLGLKKERDPWEEEKNE